MPRNQFQRMFFAFVTVVITVHAYVFYSLYVVNGNTLIQVTGASGVLEAIRTQGGVYMMGGMYPIWAVVLVEFCLAFALEIIMGSPCSFRLASRIFDPRKNHPMMFETAIICATVCIMCPLMSFYATILYKGIFPAFIFHETGITLVSFLKFFIPNFLQTVVLNFPFALFGQLFFIQPLTRRIFKLIFKN